LVVRSKEVSDRAVALYAIGLSTRQVGAALGVSFMTARRILLEAGVRLRKPGRRKKIAA